jgi:hypothetical protein
LRDYGIYIYIYETMNLWIYYLKKNAHIFYQYKVNKNKSLYI